MVQLGPLVLLASALAATAKPHGLKSVKRHHDRALELEMEERRLLEERLKPITATTIMYAEVTETKTVWVNPTPKQQTFVASSYMASSSAKPSNAPSPSYYSEGPPRQTPSFLSASAISSVVLNTDGFSSTSAAPSPAVSSQSGPAQSSPAPQSSSQAVESSLSSAVINTDAFSSSSAAPSPARSSESGPAHSSPAPLSSSQAVESLSSASAITAIVSSSSMAPSPSSQSGPAQSSPAPHSSSHAVESSLSSAPANTEVVSSSSAAPSPSRSSQSGPAQSSPAPRSSSVEVSSTSSVIINTDAVSSSSAAPSPSRSSASGPAQSSPAPPSSSSSPSAAPSPSRSSLSGSAQASPTSKSVSSAHAVSSSSHHTSSTTSSAPLPSSTKHDSWLDGTLMNGYYPDWSSWYLAPESVDFTKFDVVDFAFALPTSDNKLQFTQDNSSDMLRRLVKTAHAAGKKVKLSIGGWTGSQYFSTIVSQDWSTRAFVFSILDAYNEYNLDGIDIDWEYPGVQGAPGNAVSPNDSANFLNFLQILRWTLPSDALISLATQVWPFAGPDGNPMGDVSGFASVIDWILIMNYDIWGSSSTPGANAPLSDGCGNSTQPLANAYSAVASWTAAGMPANKITLGVPAYGYLQKSWATGLKDRRSLPPHKQDMASRGIVTVTNDNGGDSDGQVMFESLLEQGALVSDGMGGFQGAGGFFRVWDECSSTPFLKSWDSGQIITYDDPESMSLKGQFAAQAGLKGCNVFSVDGDYYQGSWPLTDAVRSGMGL